MAAKPDVIKFGVSLNNIMSRCPTPWVYDIEQFPSLTPNQLAVLNFLEHEATADNPLKRKDFCAAMGWSIQHLNSIEHQVGLVEARKSLYIGKGIQLGRAIPGVMRSRIKQAQSERRGANQAARIVLETAGVLGQHARGVQVNLNADEINVSFSETLNVMELANKKTTEKPENEIRQ